MESSVAPRVLKLKTLFKVPKTFTGFVEIYSSTKSTIPNLVSSHWFVNGVIHRDHEPAEKIYDAFGEMFCQRYYQNGNLHRENGPAVEQINGFYKGKKEYWLNGIRYTEKSYQLKCRILSSKKREN